ncbi:small secreted protein [Streptomyces sp. CS62]|uniref:small secreted protein n=1 Tax=Streptomyces sp. CS62 TaxID=3119268 RepID=UPI002F93D49A
MNKKLAAAVSGCAALVLVLSGCGDDGDEKANAWAKKVCDEWQPQLDKVEKANAEMKRVSSQDSKSDEVQKVDSAAFQTQADAYTAMAKALRDAGVPPVKDGQSMLDASAGGFDTAAKGYADVKTKIDALDAKDPAKFADGLEALGGDIEVANQGSKSAFDELNKSGLAKALNAQKGCKVASPAPTG